MTFLTEFKFLHKNQSALVGTVCKWLKSINKGSLIETVMIDFKTAFDLVDHRVLLGKLNQYKLPNVALSWFASYLRNVSFNNIISDGEMITDGVQQGPILGPLLFLMLINNLPLYTDSANTDFYADDTTMDV